MAVDEFNTITKQSESLFKDRGSKFFGFAYPVSGQEDIVKAFEEVKKEHHSARHHCYAYRLGAEGKDYRANDDGEPNHSAGDPILGQIDSLELTNVLVIVVRYFGGVKLGVGGLINAYRTAAREALDASRIINKKVQCRFKIFFSYARMNEVMRIMKKFDAQMTSNAFEITCELTTEIDLGEREAFLRSFSEMHDVVVKEIT